MWSVCSSLTFHFSLFDWLAGGRVPLIGWDCTDRNLTAQQKRSALSLNAHWLIKSRRRVCIRSFCIVLDCFITLGYCFCVHLVSASNSLRLHIRTAVHYLNTIFMPHVFFFRGNGKVFQGGITQQTKNKHGECFTLLCFVLVHPQTILLSKKKIFLTRVASNYYWSNSCNLTKNIVILNKRNTEYEIITYTNYSRFFFYKLYIWAGKKSSECIFELCSY